MAGLFPKIQRNEGIEEVDISSKPQLHEQVHSILLQISISFLLFYSPRLSLLLGPHISKLPGRYLNLPECCRLLYPKFSFADRHNAPVCRAVGVTLNGPSTFIGYRIAI